VTAAYVSRQTKLDIRPLVVLNRTASRAALRSARLVLVLLTGLGHWLQHTGRTVYVTVDRARPYALTVGGLACLVISAFTWAPMAGWAAAGTAALVFNWGLHKE
jgi:hypothetical protein